MSACALTSIAAASPQTGSLTAVELDQFSAAPSAATGAHFGRSLAVDGDRMLCASGSHSYSTHAEVLVRAAGVWTHEADLYNSHFDEFAVCLAGDLALIGVNTYGSPDNGRVLVARRGGSTWSTSWLDSPDAGATPKFGASTAISGTTVVVSDSEYAHAFAREGALYIYEDTGVDLVLRQTIYGALANGALGSRVAVHDGDLLAGVEYHDNSQVIDLRAFQRQGGQWTQTQRALGLKLAGASGLLRVEIDDWGLAVLSTYFGGAYMLASTGDGMWFRDATFIGTPPGTGVDMQLSDGVFALSAPAGAASNPTGSVYLYARNNGWKMMHQLTASDAQPGDRFGHGIELRGSHLFVGADEDDDFGIDNGAVYEYELQHDPARVYCVPQVSSIGCVPHIGFAGAPSATSSAPFTLKASKVPSFRPGFFVYSTSGAQFQALGTSVRCFAAPRFVTAHQASGGSTPGVFDCTGKLSFDCNALIQSGVDPQLIAGARVNGQFVCRDPGNPSGIAATDAVEFTILP